MGGDLYKNFHHKLKHRKEAIVTIVERVSNFFLMRKWKNGKKAKDLANELFLLLIPYKEKVLSITSDNGTEFREHQQITKDIETDFYFANPYASWERSLNEYTNKLIRQYFPKKTDFSKLTHDEINEIQYKINRRPRKKLGIKLLLKYLIIEKLHLIVECRAALIIYN